MRVNSISYNPTNKCYKVVLRNGLKRKTILVDKDSWEQNRDRVISSLDIWWSEIDNYQRRKSLWQM